MKKISFLIVIFLLVSFRADAQEKILRELLDLPAPPPVFVETEEDSKPVRSPEFYSEDKVPPDNAPIEDLLDYWQQKATDNSIHKSKVKKASLETSIRLLDVLQEAPYKFNNFLNILPLDDEVIRKVQAVFESKQATEDVSDYWRKEVKDWLKFNSNLYIDELFIEAQKIKDHKEYSSIVKSAELSQLVKVDWEKAVTILERIEDDKSNPRSAVFAKRLFYEHALREKDENEIEKYRNYLKSLIVNKSALGSERNLAFDALTENEEWQGFDEWYLSLLSDDSLTVLQIAESAITAPLISVTNKNPQKWIPILSKLVGNSNSNIHNAAVNGLVEIGNTKPSKEAMIPLLPWLTNPNWAKDTGSDRRDFICNLAKVDMPETVPALIWLVENENDDDAADVLAKYKDSRAVPALKTALQNTPDERIRKSFVLALFACNGFSDEELVSFIESYVEAIKTPEGYKKVVERDEWDDETPLPLSISIGKFLVKLGEPQDSFVALLFSRIKQIQKLDTYKAKSLLEIANKWQGRIIDLEMLRRIERGEADLETIVGALARRNKLRERVLNHIYAVRGKSGLSGAVAACVLEDENDILAAFHSEDLEKRIGTLGCARLLRKPLPVAEVGGLLNSENKLLALAAERYLEAEDSPEARALVWVKHPNEALILGARTSFNPTNAPFNYSYNTTLGRLFSSVSTAFSFSDEFDQLNKSEKKLQQEILEDQNLITIYALLPNYESGQRVVRIYKNHATFTYYEDKARFKIKKITKEEIENFLQNLRQLDIDKFVPRTVNCHHDCYVREFISLNRNGGRRIFSGSGFSSLKILDFIETYFNKEEYQTSYHLQDKIKGLEVLLTDKKFSPQMLWKNGDDFRLLISDEERKAQIEEEISKTDKIDEENEDLDYEQRGINARRRRAERAFEHLEWREFKNGKLGEKIDEPIDVPYLRENLTFPTTEDLDNNEIPGQSIFGNYSLRAGDNNKKGLWKINRSEQIEIKKGWYHKPIVSGNWVIAAKAEEDWAAPNNVVRINLQTGKEYKINLPPDEEFYPIAFVQSHNKVLLYCGKEAYSTLEPKPAEYYLLDANTGKTERVKGEFQPIITQTFRSLQPTEKSDEYWATVYSRAKNETEIGIYNMQNFTFTSILKLPEILLSSMEIWVDEKENKVYFVYSGDYRQESHLLSVPLSRK